TEGDRAFVEWSAEFSCDPSNEQELVQKIGHDVFQGGFDALKRHFGG
ncbi:MAG: SRPBCC family protein, partial [Pseudomonadota bacterium]